MTRRSFLTTASRQAVNSTDMVSTLSSGRAGADRWKVEHPPRRAAWPSRLQVGRAHPIHSSISIDSLSSNINGLIAHVELIDDDRHGQLADLGQGGQRLDEPILCTRHPSVHNFRTAVHRPRANGVGD